MVRIGIEWVGGVAAQPRDSPLTPLPARTPASIDRKQSLRNILGDRVVTGRRGAWLGPALTMRTCSIHLRRPFSDFLSGNLKGHRRPWDKFIIFNTKYSRFRHTISFFDNSVPMFWYINSHLIYSLSDKAPTDPLKRTGNPSDFQYKIHYFKYKMNHS